MSVHPDTKIYRIHSHNWGEYRKIDREENPEGTIQKGCLFLVCKIPGCNASVNWSEARLEWEQEQINEGKAVPSEPDNVIEGVFSSNKRKDERDWFDDDTVA